MDIIRVLRLIEYVGPRDLVEDQLSKSVHGTRTVNKSHGRSITIRAVTLGEVSEILGQEVKPDYYVCAYGPRANEYTIFAGQFSTLDLALIEVPMDSNLPAYILSGTNKSDDLKREYVWYDGDKEGWHKV